MSSKHKFTDLRNSLLNPEKFRADKCFKEIFGVPMTEDEFEVSNLYGGLKKEEADTISQKLKRNRRSYTDFHETFNLPYQIMSAMAERGVTFTEKRKHELVQGMMDLTNSDAAGTEIFDRFVSSSDSDELELLKNAEPLVIVPDVPLFSRKKIKGKFVYTME